MQEEDEEGNEDRHLMNIYYVQRLTLWSSQSWVGGSVNNFFFLKELRVWEVKNPSKCLSYRTTLELNPDSSLSLKGKGNPSAE